MLPDSFNAELNEGQFEKISQMVYRLAGINLHVGKQELVKSRLVKRLRMTGISNFDEYIAHVEKNPSSAEFTAMLDVLTTNKTSFFRESAHLDYLGQHIAPSLPKPGPTTIWSAGCSTGEEPYSMAITLREAIPDIDSRNIRILATDLSTRVLSAARNGEYTEDKVADVAPGLRAKYFSIVPDAATPTYKVKDSLRKMITFAHLNLMSPWPMKGPFNAIFCRNVMIYFDKPTQAALVHRFWELLQPGGHLFVGHSESLVATSHEFRYVRPALYVK